MGRPCLICLHPDRAAIEATIVAGTSDYEVGRRFRVERVSVGRHRRNHILKPTRDRLTLIARDTAERHEREKLSAAVASNAPTPAQFVEAFFGLKAQAEKLERIEARLERMAAVAEAGGSPTGVATLAAQQLRGIETGAKLVGLPGFVPARATDHAVAGSKFEVNIVFTGAGRTESFTVATPLAATIDGDGFTSDPENET
jgi:hypothetical protein